MAVIAKKSGGAIPLKELLKVFQKDYGEAIGSFGGTWVNTDRIETGLFPLDLALGGGFPMNKTMVVWGPESAGKTNIALLTLAEHQRKFPDKICIFFDIENSFDPEWGAKLGVDTAKLVVLRPSYAEQATDMFEAAVMADDCGLIVFDSIAAMMTSAEMSKSAEQDSMGGASKAIGKMCRKIGLALMESDKQGRRPTIILINQTRSKVGFVLGFPDMMPGGHALKHLANIILRVYGKNEMDQKISTTMPVRKVVKFVIEKWKCPILNMSGMFAMTTIPHDNMKVGQCDDFNTVSEYLKSFGQFEKHEKKGWVVLGEHYPTIADFKSRMFDDVDFGAAVRKKVIAHLMATSETLQGEPGEGEGTDDAV